MFFDEPRICMGLNPNHTRVIHQTKADEEQRFRGITEKRHSVAEVEVTGSHSD